MPLDERVRAALAALDLPYDEVPCEDAWADTAAFCAHTGWPEQQSANCILVAAKEDPPRYAACVLLATTRLDVNRTVRKKLGAKRASFATADETAALTGMRIGGVTPFGLPPGVPLWIDPRVLACDRVILGGGTRTAKVRLAPDLLLRIPGAEVVPDLARPAEGP